ncbi:hypothetical protein ETAE_0049 [Edwardsiella piscicida]|uniref:Uncharacterized protein n=1 Tax=Edwardsiella piscicida TaxID=1263550 RepID=A0AAU8P6Y5_EDWPI|nr:hypothetical protein ETAE_0049 [Edwardsiella tarda EIB202]
MGDIWRHAMNADTYKIDVCQHSQYSKMAYVMQCHFENKVFLFSTLQQDGYF